MRDGYFDPGLSFASVIRAAIGPEERLRILRDKYIRGDIELDEFERQVEDTSLARVIQAEVTGR